jgi:outer membrane receptor protein involved in Fe transport
MTFVNESEIIPSFIDANLHMNYNYRENISFKIMLNNLLGKTYNRWANYPVVGFNGMAGIQFSF